MPDRPITKDRVVAAARWRARRLVRQLRGRTSPAEIIPAARFSGLVEGFAKDKVRGWVAVQDGAGPTRVSLLVNELEVAATWATDQMKDRHNWGEIRSFDFRLRDVWSYAKTRYKVTVRVDGKTLPIAGHGMYVEPASNGRHDLAALKGKLDAGYVFSQIGRLQLSKKLDTEWQAKVMSLYGRVRDTLAEVYGYDVFFVYGTLLGSVREGGVIGHDLDFDSAYVSKHTDGKAAAKELLDIAFVLIDRGFDVQCMRTALHIQSAGDSSTKIDLFHLYFDAKGELAFPFGVAGTTVLRTSDWTGMKEVDFCGARGLVPINDELVVEHIYGAGWRSPKPGFDWKRDRTKRAWAGVTPDVYEEEAYWANFYAKTEFTTGSPFFDLVNARPDFPSSVIDIGCGDGRDSFAFGVAGRRVLGLDRSEVGVRHARKKAEEMDFADRVRFVACDVGHADDLRAALRLAIDASDGPVAFYLRFFLHSIPEDVQDTLMGVVAECARPGDLFAAEFRTDQDEALAKTYAKHYRRFQNGPAFGVALREKYGFEVLEENEGTGLSPYQDEDPELYRVIARRGPA